MKNKSLTKNYIYNLISQVLVLIIPLITSPYLARVLGEVENGKISFASSIITYFLLISNLGFSLYGQRQISMARNNDNEKSKYFYEIFLSKAICTAFSFLLLSIIIFSVGFGDKYNKLILILSIQIIASVFDITYYFQGLENFKAIALRSIFIKVSGLILIFIFVKNVNDAWIYVLILSLVTIISNLIMWPSALKTLNKVKLRELNLLRNIKPSLLIFLPTLAVTIYSVLDKTMIGLLSTNPDYDNGCYEQAYKINSVALLLITVISPIMIPRNAYDYNSGNIDSLKKHIYFSSNYVWLLGIPLIAGFFVLAPNLSCWFLGSGYAEVPNMLRIMSIRFLASGLSVVFGEQLFIAIGKEKYTTIATGLSGCINFILNFWLIPIYGGIGAAITTAVAEILVCLILMYFVFKQKIISLKHIFLMPIKYLISAGLMFGVIYIMQKYMNYSFFSFMIITITGGSIYFLALFILRDKFFILLLRRWFTSIKGKFIKEKK